MLVFAVWQRFGDNDDDRQAILPYRAQDILRYLSFRDRLANRFDNNQAEIKLQGGVRSQEAALVTHSSAVFGKTGLNRRG